MGNSYDVRATVVNIGDNSTTVHSGDALLHGIYVNTVLSAHACPIENGVGTALMTLPASTGAGTNIDCHGARFVGSLVVDPDDSGTGNITVFWSPR